VIRGLYIGCGNGRNYLPLVAGGLDLTGLDISSAAIAQLAARAPDRRDRLVVGDLSALPAQSEYPLLIGIQMFQHGDRAAAHAHIRAALSPRTRSSSPPPRSNARPSGLPNRSNPSAMRAIGPPKQSCPVLVIVARDRTTSRILSTGHVCRLLSRDFADSKLRGRVSSRAPWPAFG
jgi:Methyltransferase domain